MSSSVNATQFEVRNTDLSVLKKLKAVAFDLDDTLFDTYGQLVSKAAFEAVDAMIAKGLPLKREEAFKLREKLFKQNSRKNVFETMAKEVGLTGDQFKDVSKAGFHAFHNRKVESDISVFASVPDTLFRLKERHQLYCVTIGNPDTQKQKIKHLGIAKYFDKIWYVDVESGFNKKAAYQEMLLSYRLQPEQVLSVGNRIDSEIRDSKELGMWTCLMLHGEYLHLTPSSDVEKPDFAIKDIGELISVLHL